MSDTVKWSVYYRDKVISGIGPAVWPAEDTGVQVIVEWRKPELHERRWYKVEDRFLWTGEDSYDPFGYGVVYGSLLPDDEYFAIWERAAYGEAP